MSATEPGASGARGRNRRGEGGRLRDRIIAAADELVAEAGDARTLSLRAVAARCGIATTSIYLHFDDLERLKTAVALHGFAEFARVRDEAVVGDHPPAVALGLRCRAYVRYAVAHPGRYRLMFGRELGPLATTAGPDNAAQSTLDALVRSIAACSSTTTGRSVAARLAILVWTGLHGQASLRIDRPGVAWPPIDDMVDDLLSAVVGIPPTTPVRVRARHSRQSSPGRSVASSTVDSLVVPAEPA